MLLVTATLVCLTGLTRNSSRAQADPVADISPAAGVDITQFPLVTIRDRCSVDPTRSPMWTAVEDNRPKKLVANRVDRMRPHSQSAILIDLFDHRENLLEPIRAGIDVLYQLYERRSLLIELDELALYLPGATADELDPVTTWTGDAGVLRNDLQATITSERGYKSLDRTALNTLLWQLLNAFPRGVEPLRRQIVLFSDGTDSVGNTTVDNVIQAAQAQNIRIHTIYIDTGYVNKPQLKRLATETGGQFLELRDQLNEQGAWETFWLRLIEEVTYCNITYRSSNIQPRQLLVQAVLSNTVQFSQAYTFPQLALTPPQIQIDTPRAGTTLPLSTTDGMTIAPSALKLALAWEFAPHLPRAIQQIRYEVRGADIQITATVSPPPMAQSGLQLTVPQQVYLPGPYIVAVQVVDELGLIGEAQVPFAFSPLPTPTPTATPTVMTPPPTPTALPTATPLWYVRPVNWARTDLPYRLLLLSITPLVGLLAFGLFRSWQQLRARPDPFLLGREKEKDEPIQAILYRVDGEADHPLRQVVKLNTKNSESVLLPKALYTTLHEAKPKPGKRPQNRENFHAQIARNGAAYYLQLLDGSRPIRYKRQGNEGYIDASLKLEHNDILILGESQYTFYLLTDLSMVPTPVLQTIRTG